jgi:hypothetical protein
MTEEDKEFQEFLDMFTKIPNPESYPKCFEMCIKLYRHYKSKKTTSDLKSF